MLRPATPRLGHCRIMLMIQPIYNLPESVSGPSKLDSTASEKKRQLMQITAMETGDSAAYL